MGAMVADAMSRADAAVLLHNPRCSKSRAAKALLDERGVAYRERRYLDDPLSLDELRALAAQLDAEPSRWVRSGEDAWTEAGLSPASSLDAVLRAIAAHPILLERPIFVRADRAVVGRPPERILDLL
jgi:arsenate reductase